MMYWHTWCVDDWGVGVGVGVGVRRFGGSEDWALHLWKLGPGKGMVWYIRSTRYLPR